MAEIHGQCDPTFEKVKELLKQNIDSEEELGASICVNINGTNAVDIWGGYKDAQRTQPWESDTLVVVWSTTKCVTSFVALLLVERGLLSPFDKVSKHWPEFAANGKEDIEVRHIMSHSAGLPTWDPPQSIDRLYDAPKAAAMLAEQAPWWAPGTVSGYHALTQGHLMGELVRRITGKSLTQFLAEEITGPLGADFQLGAPPKDWGRIAELTIAPLEGPPPSPDPKSIAARAAGSGPRNPQISATPGFRNAELSAANGFGNARSVAQTLCPISLGGTVNGKKFLSPETIDLIFREQTNSVDLILGSQVRWGIGFALPEKKSAKPWIPNGRICYWSGWGGSIVIMDLDRKLTIAYAMNKMGEGTVGTRRTEQYVRAIYEAIGVQV